MQGRLVCKQLYLLPLPASSVSTVEFTVGYRTNVKLGINSLLFNCENPNSAENGSWTVLHAAQFETSSVFAMQIFTIQVKSKN